VVTVNYRGTLIDGTEFDSSYKAGNQFTRSVMGVIRGWTEALQMMKVARNGSFLFRLTSPTARAPADRISDPTQSLFLKWNCWQSSRLLLRPAPSPFTSDIIKVPSAEDLKKGAKIEVNQTGCGCPEMTALRATAFADPRELIV